MQVEHASRDPVNSCDSDGSDSTTGAAFLFAAAPIEASCIAGPSAAALSSRSDPSSRAPILIEGAVPSARGGAGGADEDPSALSAAEAAANLLCSRTAFRVASSSAFRFSGPVQWKTPRCFGTLTPTVIMPLFCGLHCTPSTTNSSSVAAIARRRRQSSRL